MLPSVHIRRNRENSKSSAAVLISRSSLYSAFPLQRVSAAPTRRHIAALGFIFQLGGFPNITQNFVVKTQLQRFTRLKPSQDLRLSITPPIMSKIISDIPLVANSAFLISWLQAMFFLASCAFLRVGEITKRGKQTSTMYLENTWPWSLLSQLKINTIDNSL